MHVNWLTFFLCKSLHFKCQKFEKNFIKRKQWLWVQGIFTVAHVQEQAKFSICFVTDWWKNKGTEQTQFGWQPGTWSPRLRQTMFQRSGVIFDRYTCRCDNSTYITVIYWFGSIHMPCRLVIFMIKSMFYADSNCNVNW